MTRDSSLSSPVAASSSLLLGMGMVKLPPPSFHHALLSSDRSTKIRPERPAPAGKLRVRRCSSTFSKSGSSQSVSVHVWKAVSTASAPSGASVPLGITSSGGRSHSPREVPRRTPQCSTAEVARSLVSCTVVGPSGPSGCLTATSSSAFDPSPYARCHTQDSSRPAASMAAARGRSSSSYASIDSSGADCLISDITSRCRMPVVWPRVTSCCLGGGRGGCSCCCCSCGASFLRSSFLGCNDSGP
mmetsp:Transcript_20854/g.62760  ORF Transcript_20854/g.62760 Transcript_20854/m.62760 type:complete len:244 (-) Transcript_20854:1335-2066(-)